MHAEEGGPPPADAANDGSGAHDGALDRAQLDVGESAWQRGEDFLAAVAEPRPDGGLRVAFDVPEGVEAFVMTVAPEAPRELVLRELAVDDAVVFRWAEPDQSAFAPVSVHNLADALPFAFLYPSAPETALRPGRVVASFALGSLAARTGGRVRVDVVFQRALEASEGALELMLWFVAGAALDAEAARQDAFLAEALAGLGAIYAQVGIAISVLDHRDLPMPSFAVLEDPQLPALLAELEGGDERAAHVVFVDAFSETPGKTVRAKTSGIPGPPAHPALTRRGAVLVALSQAPASSERFAEMLGHELGHYLGLSHTSEWHGAQHDPIADTPECDAGRAGQRTADGEPLLSAEDCAGFGGGNLMFYTPPRSSAFRQDTLSPGQGAILRRNPSVR